MNPMQILQNFFGKGGNPEQLLQKAIGMSGNNNPMIANLMSLAKSGNKEQVEQFARNVCKERGIDFDKEFSAFISQIKSK